MLKQRGAESKKDKWGKGMILAGGKTALRFSNDPNHDDKYDVQV